MRLHTLAAGALALACLTPATVARAEPDPPAEAKKVGPVAIAIEGADAHHAAIRRAILKELSTTDDPTSARRIDLKIQEEIVDIRFTDDDGHTTGRKLERPEDDDEMVELVALMAGNLARDQAGALLAELLVEEKEEPPTEAAVVEKAPVAEEKPIVEKKKKKRRKKPRARKRAPKPAPSPDPPVQEKPKWPLSPVQASLVPPAGIYQDSVERRFAFDFSLVLGRSGGLNGFGLHAFGSHVHGDVLGTSIAGLWAYRSGELRGASFAGLFHAADARETEGLELAGLLNLDVFGEQPSRVTGVQLAGLANASGSVRGAQVSGVVNVSNGEKVSGAQVGGIANVSTSDVHGTQVAGITNVSSDGAGVQLGGITNHAGSFDGVQISGVVNTAQEIRGVQMGLVNVAGKVKGAQIGLINVAEENEGAAVGLLNFAGDGDVQVAMWGSLNTLSNVGLKMRVGPLFFMPSAGYHPFDGNRFSGQGSVGGHIPIDPVFIEIVGTYAYDYTLEDQDESGMTVPGEGHHTTRLVVQVGAQFGDYFGIFGGTGVHWDITKHAEEDTAGVRPELVAGVLLF